MAEHLWYTASGTLTLNPPVASARTLSGGSAAPGRLGSWSEFTSSLHPNTGKLMEGFHWDERTWYQENTENIAQTVPNNWDTTISGITQSYFQSGIGSGRDLEFERVDNLPSSGLFSSIIYKPWAPVVRHGHYYDYEEEGYLYSDDSEVVYPTASGIVTGISPSGVITSAGGARSQVQLTSIPKVGVPIRADRYRWDNDAGKYVIDLSVRKVSEFTGVRDSNLVRQSTWNDSKKAILWEMIDDTDPEFMVIDSGNNQSIPYAVFNSQFATAHPSTTAYENLGYSTGATPQQFHLQYAPVDSEMNLEVYSYTAIGGSWRQWSPITTSGDFTVATGVFQVKVDYDLGVLEFGSATNSGINVPPAGDTVVANYYRTLRVEYEPEWLSDLATGYEANVNPIYRTSGRGFVYLSTRANDAAAISLTASAPAISANLFGPVYIGNTYVPVVATITDARGLPVEGATADIFITSDPPPGRFGSFGTSASAVTNHIGEGRAFYNPPAGVSEIGETITASGYSRDPVTQTTTLEVEDLLLEGSLNDIFLYQIWTNDPSQGWYTPGAGTSDEDQLNDYYESFFGEESIFGPTGLTGSALSNLGGTRTSADWETDHRTAWDMLQTTIFNASAGNGKKVLCATYDGKAYDPHTFQFGAVAPFQPTGVVPGVGGGYSVTFDTSSYELPIPSGSFVATAPSGIIYGYFMVAPTTVTMQASTYNERRNQTIYSNPIQVKLQIPSYLNGMWYIDAINQTHIDEISSLLASGIVVGSGVPLGFRLRSSSVTLASALDGVTFLDVNPTYNAPIWEVAQPAIVGSGVTADGLPYVQHKVEVV